MHLQLIDRSFESSSRDEKKLNTHISNSTEALSRRFFPTQFHASIKALPGKIMIWRTDRLYCSHQDYCNFMEFNWTFIYHCSWVRGRSQKFHILKRRRHIWNRSHLFSKHLIFGICIYVNFWEGFFGPFQKDPFQKKTSLPVPTPSLPESLRRSCLEAVFLGREFHGKDTN